MIKTELNPITSCPVNGQSQRDLRKHMARSLAELVAYPHKEKTLKGLVKMYSAESKKAMAKAKATLKSNVEARKAAAAKAEEAMTDENEKEPDEAVTDTPDAQQAPAPEVPEDDVPEDAVAGTPEDSASKTATTEAQAKP